MNDTDKNSMFIEKLVLKNFRNYKNEVIKFSPGYNFFIGDNGSGKSNILEAITVISDIRSFRGSADDDMIGWGGNWYYCKAVVNDDNENTFEIGFSREEGKSVKKVKINNNIIKKAAGYYGKFLTVTISPDDITLVSGTPDHRRRYFDAILAKVDPVYYENLSNFKKVIFSRNRVLKELKEKRSDAAFNHLDTWTHLLSKISSVIITKRILFLKEYSEFFSDAYYNISGKDFIPLLDYYNNSGAVSEDDIFQVFKKSSDRDIATGATNRGPHRDDYILMNDRRLSFKVFSSQGQKRTAAISLKTAELSFIENCEKKKPLY